MKRYLIAYGLWLAGVLSAAAVAWAYYRKVLAIGEEAIAVELNGDKPASRHRAVAPEPPPVATRESRLDPREPPVEEG